MKSLASRPSSPRIAQDNQSFSRKGVILGLPLEWDPPSQPGRSTGVEGALVAIDNATGVIKAMVGARDFNLSKFNRATQALRQVGSSFKPYVSHRRY